MVDLLEKRDEAIVIRFDRHRKLLRNILFLKTDRERIFLSLSNKSGHEIIFYSR